MIELLRKRRSIRVYQGRPVEPKKIELLKEAVLRAPSSRSIDPWEFIFVDDPGLLGALSRCKPHGAAFLQDAPLGVVICGDRAQSDVWIEDCSIASILLQLTAQSLGLGSCWIQVRQRRYRDNITSEQYIQERLGIPSHVNVESIIAIGYPAEEREPLPQKQLKVTKVHSNRF